VEELAGLGYFGAFVISLVANATIILPMPGLLILIALGAILNPVVVALVGAVGGALGEMSGYLAGLSGREVVAGNKMFTRAEAWMKRWGSLAVFAFALAPFLPLDVAGMVAGALRFPVWKFLVACFLGKAVLYIIWISVGAWGWEALLRFFG